MNKLIVNTCLYCRNVVSFFILLELVFPFQLSYRISSCKIFFILENLFLMRFHLSEFFMTEIMIIIITNIEFNESNII